MKYDKTKLILGIDGKAIVERPGEPELTFGKVVMTALLTDALDPRAMQSVTGEEKQRRFMVAIRIEQAEQFFELSIEEAALAKRLLAIFPPVYVGRCFEILDKPESATPQ